MNNDGATNAGFGIVAVNWSDVDRMENLFEEKARWTSEELNDEIGWQFSQAIYGLRKRYKRDNRPYVIITIRLEKHEFAYERREKGH